MKRIIPLILLCVFLLVGCTLNNTDIGEPVSEIDEAENTAEVEEEKWDLVPMVMVDGVLYYDTGHNNNTDLRCGNLDGEITSTVEGWEIPSRNNQSNFGIGYGYQYGSIEGTVDINLYGKWRIFATEEVRRSIQFPIAVE